MRVKTLTPTRSLNPAYRKEKVRREDIDRLKRELPLLLDRTRGKVSESTLRDHWQTFLREVSFPATDFLVQSEVRRMDTVIHDGPKRKDPIGVIIEAKAADNRSEMFRPEQPNVKSLHELVLYFLRERDAGNTAIKQLLITDGAEVYLFADREFERLFWEKKRFRKRVLAADADRGKTNAVAYDLIRAHVDDLAAEEIQCTVVQLPLYRHACEDGDPETDRKLIPLYKVLSPVHLLRRPFAGDSNHLDKGFYRELLHLIGLEEVGVDSKGRVKKSGGGKKIIRRATGANRHPASLLENTLQVARKEDRFRHVPDWRDYGADDAERAFAVALELCLTWVNRVLFLKLLETQLVGYHGQDAAYRFLTPGRIPDYDALNSLFFDVLNRPVAEREDIVAEFGRVPYLNSSLFEISELEDRVIRINSLKDQYALPLADRSVLRGRQDLFPAAAERPTLQPLHYLFTFLDAYDFGGEGQARIQEDNKRLINASVLGLIFEKINGYRDGSFYTPGFITEYMCRQTIRRAVVQKFRADETAFAEFTGEDFTELRNYLRRDNYKTEVRLAANALVNSLTVCDPAVGSGHFLVSALNELIATKSELGILGAEGGARELPVDVRIANDELIVTWRRDDEEPYEYRVETDSDGRIHVAPEIQDVQAMLFGEKRTLIEDCLFGVDLNPNSVKICRLRLWIELLKNAYYTHAEEQSKIPNQQSKINHLQTLPNIDINIKQGNSLISRFALDDDLGGALAESQLTLADYRRAVADYHRAQGRAAKAELLDLIERVKHNFQSHISRNDKRVKKLATARGKLEKLQSLLEVGDLFGSVDERKVKKEMKPLQKQVDRLEAELAGIRDNAIYENAFEWRFEFPAVLGERGEYLGFDVVVGNPPYVRQEELTAIKPYLEQHYEVYAGTADLLVYFIELAMRNLRPYGQFSYIVSNKFMRAGFGKALRSFVPQFRVHELLDFGDLPVFDGATTYPLIISLEKAAPAETFLAANLTELDRDHFREHLATVAFPSLQTSLTADGWNLADVPTQQLLEKLKTTGTPLGEYINGEIYYGIKTGYNEAFVIDAATKDRLIAEDPKSAEVIKPFLSGKDINSYYHDPVSKYLIFIPWHFPLHEDKSISGPSKNAELAFKNAYPIIYRYLEEYKTPLNNRNRSEVGIRYEWYALQRCAATYFKEFSKIKIVWPEVGVQNTASLVAEDVFLNKTTFMIPIGKDFQYHSLLAILNSSLIKFYLNEIVSKMRGGYFMLSKIYMETIPIANNNAKFIENSTFLVTRILTTKQVDPTADTSAWEAEIDVLVYRLYGLTYEEVRLVDPEFGMSEEAYDKITVV